MINSFSSSKLIFNSSFNNNSSEEEINLNNVEVKKSGISFEFGLKHTFK